MVEEIPDLAQVPVISELDPDFYEDPIFTTQEDCSVPIDDREKLQAFVRDKAHKLHALQVAIEEKLYNDVQGKYQDLMVPTLPHRLGKEDVSTIQPVAWIENGFGGYYDPTTKRLVKNSIEYEEVSDERAKTLNVKKYRPCWSGNAKSMGQHIENTLLGCPFTGYYIITLISIGAGIVLYGKVLNKGDEIMEPYRAIALCIMLLIPFIFLAVFIGFIIYNERKITPAHANSAQKHMNKALKQITENMASSVIIDTYKGNRARALGWYLLDYFYVPLVLAFEKSFGKKPDAEHVSKEWIDVESWLICFRFIREVSNSIECLKSIPKNKNREDYSDTVVSGNKINYWKNYISAVVTKGPALAHSQMLRLMFNNMNNVSDKTKRLKWKNETGDKVYSPANLSLRSYLGKVVTDDIMANKIKLMKRDVIKQAGPRLYNVERLLDRQQKLMDEIATITSKAKVRRVSKAQP